MTAKNTKESSAMAEKLDGNDDLDIRIIALDFLKNPAGSYRYRKAVQREVDAAVKAVWERIHATVSTNNHH